MPEAEGTREVDFPVAINLSIGEARILMRILGRISAYEVNQLISGGNEDRLISEDSNYRQGGLASENDTAATLSLYELIGEYLNDIAPVPIQSTVPAPRVDPLSRGAASVAEHIGLDSILEEDSEEEEGLDIEPDYDENEEPIEPLF